MPTLAAIAVAIQFCFAIHVIRQGRSYWWILLIMAIPLLGCLVYYFIEVLPHSRAYLEAQPDDGELTAAIDPDVELKRRIAELAACASVERRMALAEEYARRQMHGEAEKLYASCLTGVFQADAAILFRFARAAANNCNWSKASEAVARLRQAAPRMWPHEVASLEARILAGQSENRTIALS